MNKYFLIKDSYVDTRLDRWFKKEVCDVPQSLIEKNLRKGNIKVNREKVKSSFKLKIGDKVFVKILNLESNKIKKKNYKYIPTKKDLSSTSDLFIEDNENFVVINKPSGIAVQSGTKSIKNILDILRNSKEFANSSPYTVHRLDKETTGLLIVAKNRKYAQLFTSLFRLRKIHKTYLGISIGELKNDKGTLEDELFYYEGNKKIKTRAITHYNVIDTNNRYSFLRLNPETGRKHQIRKQLLIHGCPIFGDNKYRITNNHSNKNDCLMLHAYKIKFIINNTKYNFSVEPPLPFIKFLKQKYLKNFL